MKPLKTLLLTSVLASVSGAFAEAPRLDVDVFVSGHHGYHSYRIPAIERAPDGTLVAVAEARKYTSSDPGMGKQEIDLVYKRSTDNGATWSDMAVLEHSGDLWASANPATVLDRTTGKIWVFYVRARPERSSDSARPGTDDMRNLARWSADNGKTWSEPVDLTGVARDMNDNAWKVSVPGPGGAIQTKSGRIVVAMWKMPFSDFAIYSDDHGATWRRGAIIPGGQGGDECKVVELSNGNVLIDMRQEVGPNRWLSESSDGGATWGDLRPGVWVTPVACAIKRIADPSVGSGRGWLVWTGPESTKRKHLVIRTSSDDGHSFPYSRLITNDYSAYSDLVLLPDGSVGVLWERGMLKNYEFITFTRLSPHWLKKILPKAPAG